MNAQVHHREGEERKIYESNNMIMKPHHSLMKAYIITTPVKCMYASLFIIYLLYVQSKWEKENTKRRKGIANSKGGM